MLVHTLAVRCPRCESSSGEDFFQNTVRQSRSIAGADILEGGLGSVEFDSQIWTCKKCMVRCVSDKEFEEQRWQAGLLNLTPEERKAEITRKTEEKAKEAQRAKEAEWQAIKEYTPSDWGYVAFGFLIIGLVISGIIYIVS